MRMTGAVCVIVLAMASPAAADLSYDNYLVLAAAKQRGTGTEGDRALALDYYLNGLLSGFGWANVQLERSGYKPLFCQPDHLALGPSAVQEMLEDYIANDLPSVRQCLTNRDVCRIDPLVLLALERSFPCK